MGTMLCVAGFREGAGRTSTAVNFAASLAVLEKRVLLVDCNPDGKASVLLGFDPEDETAGLGDLLTGIVGARGVIRKTDIETLDLIPTGHELSSLDENLRLNPDRDRVLGIVFDKFKGLYDYIIFDMSSERGLLARSVFMACESLMIPVGTGGFSMGPVYEVLDFAGEVRLKTDEPIRIAGLLPTHFENVSEAGTEMDKMGFDVFRSVIFPVTVPFSSLAGVFQKESRPALLVDVKSDYAEAFLDLSYEFLYREQQIKRS